MNNTVVTKDNVHLEIQPDMKVATRMQVLHGKLTEETRMWLIEHHSCYYFSEVLAVLKSRRVPTSRISADRAAELMWEGSRERHRKAKAEIIHDRKVIA